MSTKKLLNVVKNNELQKLSIYLENEEDVNTKDDEGWALLHYAVINENADMVKVLLKSGADPTLVTNEGDTPLHIATRKGCIEIVNLLLKHATICQINYINTRTILHEDTPLHMAARNGFMNIVISLLSHGAIYNIQNKDNEIPLNLSKAYNVKKILSLTNDCFEKAKIGDMDVINKLKDANVDEFSAIMNSRNNQNHPLIQEAMINHHHKLTAKLLEMRVDIDSPLGTVKATTPGEALPDSTVNSLNTIDKLKRLKTAADNYLRFSTSYYLPELRSWSKPYGSDKNPYPNRTLQVGSYLLTTIQSLTDEYRKYIPGEIEDEDIKVIYDTLVYLQFNKNHILNRSYKPDDGETANFVSTGQGTVYYSMLHTDINADVRVFIDIAEKNFNTPVERFLDRVTQKLKSFL